MGTKKRNGFPAAAYKSRAGNLQETSMSNTAKSRHLYRSWSNNQKGEAFINISRSAIVSVFYKLIIKYLGDILQSNHNKFKGTKMIK